MILYINEHVKTRRNKGGNYEKIKKSFAAMILLFGNLLPTVQTMADVVDEPETKQGQLQTET